MPSVVLLTDENIIEGIIGSVTLALTAIILRRVIHAPRSVILGMSFIISWFFRRIGVNIYRYLKTNHLASINALKYNIVKNK